MSILYRIDKAEGYTLVLWDGVVTAGEFLAHAQRLSSDPDWPPPGRRHLACLNTATLDPSLDEGVVKMAAGLFGRQPDKLARMKVAIVADTAFWISAGFQRFISKYGASSIVFNDLVRACTWLDL